MRRRVLLVEDDPGDQELFRWALKSPARYELLTAQDGQEALAAALGPDAPPFTLVVLDLQLPKVSGLEVLRGLRADPRTRFTPVVMLSSSAEPRDIEACLAAGANSYVRKAVGAEAFNARVALIESYWLDANETLER